MELADRVVTFNKAGFQVKPQSAPAAKDTSFSQKDGKFQTIQVKPAPPGATFPRPKPERRTESAPVTLLSPAVSPASSLASTVIQVKPVGEASVATPVETPQETPEASPQPTVEDPQWPYRHVSVTHFDIYAPVLTFGRHKVNPLLTVDETGEASSRVLRGDTYITPNLSVIELLQTTGLAHQRRMTNLMTEIQSELSLDFEFRTHLGTLINDTIMNEPALAGIRQLADCVIRDKVAVIEQRHATLGAGDYSALSRTFVHGCLVLHRKIKPGTAQTIEREIEFYITQAHTCAQIAHNLNPEHSGKELDACTHSFARAKQTISNLGAARQAMEAAFSLRANTGKLDSDNFMAEVKVLATGLSSQLRTPDPDKPTQYQWLNHTVRLQLIDSLIYNMDLFKKIKTKNHHMPAYTQAFARKLTETVWELQEAQDIPIRKDAFSTVLQTLRNLQHV